MSAASPLVIVDVQPTYVRDWAPLGALMERISDHDGPVLMLIVGDSEGLTRDSEFDCRAFWEENGMGERAWSVQVHDKGYGFLRSWMDLGVDQDHIVAVIREMIAREAQDSRSLPAGTIERLLGEDFEPDLLEEPLFLGSIDVTMMRSMNGCDLCGGGRDECLAEVAILFDAYKVQHRIDEDFVYDGSASCAPRPAMGY